MPNIKTARFSKLIQIMLVLAIFMAVGSTVFFLVEHIAEHRRTQAVLEHLYSLFVPLIENLIDKMENNAETPLYYEVGENYPTFTRALSIFRWEKEQWQLVTSIGKGTLSEKLLTQLFPANTIEQEFAPKDKALIYKENKKTLTDPKEPYIVIVSPSKNHRYLAVIHLSPVFLRLSTHWLDDMKRTSFLIYTIFSVAASILIVLLLRNNVSRQSRKTKTLSTISGTSAQKLWPEFVPLFNSFKELYSKIEEQKFEFERDAAVITAKAETRLRSLALIKDIATIANNVLEEESMLMQIMERANRFFKTHSAATFLVREDGYVQTISTGPIPPDFRDELNKLFRTYKELRQRQLNEVGFMFIDDISHILHGTKLLDIAQKNGIIGLLRIPIKYKGEYSGAIHLYSQRVFPHDEATEKLLNAISEEVSVALENRRLYKNLESKLKESMVLYEVSKVMISATESELLLEQLLWVVQESFGFAAVSILLVDEEAGELYVKSAWGFSENVAQRRIKLGTGITGWVATTSQPLIVGDVSQDKRYIISEPEIRSEMAVPLIVDGKVIGVLDVQSRELNRFSDRDLWFLSSLAALASLAIDRARIYEKLREQAIRDSLTGLYNRRFAENFVKTEAKEALLVGKPVSIVMIDINSLKAVNDIYGHSAGDGILIDTSKFLTDCFPSGVVVRYGGDEFLTFLIGVDSKELDEVVAEFRRKKNAWQTLMIRKNSYPIDFAIGSATVYKPEELEVIIDYADSLMYADKQGGIV